MNLTDSIGFIINNAGRNLSLLITNQFMPYGITPEQWAILKCLHEQDGISIKQLSNQAKKDQANVTRILDLLVRRGFVERRINTDDKRSTLAFLTDEGRLLTEKLIPLYDRVQAIALEGLTENEVLLFKQILSKINKNVQGS